MKGFNDDCQMPNTAFLAASLEEFNKNMKELQRREEDQKAQRYLGPLAKGMEQIAKLQQEQNSMYEKQIEMLEKEAQEAKRDAKKAKIWAAVSFGITTVISIVAIIISAL